MQWMQCNGMYNRETRKSELYDLVSTNYSLYLLGEISVLSHFNFYTIVDETRIIQPFPWTVQQQNPVSIHSAKVL